MRSYFLYLIRWIFFVFVFKEVQCAVFLLSFQEVIWSSSPSCINAKMIERSIIDLTFPLLKRKYFTASTNLILICMGTKVERLLILINTIILISLFSVCFSQFHIIKEI